MTTGIQAFSVTVNGEAREVAPGTSVRDVLRTFDVDPETARGVAVAVNDEVVRRADWAETLLRADDAVEVITAVQGG